MKHSRLALLITTTFFSLPALAASVTMLQFGSFETREEAEKRIAEIKGKYAAPLAGVEVAVRQVALPPDNLIVYRTQAGPVADRPSAQAICTKFAAAGDECYIVQTAMVSPSVTIPPAAAKTETPSVNVATTVSAVEQAKDEVAAVSAPAPDLTSNPSVLSPIPQRDERSRQSLAGIHIMPSSNELPQTLLRPMQDRVAQAGQDTVAAAAASSDMQLAMDHAVAEQVQQIKSVDHVIEDAQNKQPHSFWARLNPFSDDEPAVAPKIPEVSPEVAREAAAVAVQAQEAKAAELARAEAVKLAPAAAPEIPAADISELKEKDIRVALQEPEKLKRIEAMPQIASPIMMREEPMLLPPPPAPLKSQTPIMAQQVSPIATGTVAPPLPVMQRPLPPLSKGEGRVNVEEAKRVPVTNAAQPAPLMASVIPPASQQQPPSATNGLKSLWAQIGPFADGTAAMNFWANYRMSHPDFPVVRVRVTTPYQAQIHGQNQAWLRVGPMARSSSVDNLCASLGAMTNLQCGRITDLGMASGTGRTPGTLPGSRYQR